MSTRVLVIEDERAFALLLKRALEAEDISADLAGSAEEGRRRAQSGEFQVVLSDLYLRGPGSLDELLEELLVPLRNFDPHLPVIIMTARHTTEAAIEAIKQGAYDYFPKPDAFDLDNRSGQSQRWVQELAVMIENAAESWRLTAPVHWEKEPTAGEGGPGTGWLTGTVNVMNSVLKSVFKATERTSDPQAGEDRIIGKSRAMQEVFKAIGRAAASDLTVLIRGETGTGKELAARALYSHGPRSKQPFIVVNSAAIPEHLLESELFGHEKGAFTDANARRIGRFEQADRGTIFLDEIGDMSFPLQQKLLRVLQEKTIERVGGAETIPVDVRVIAATHRDLELAVQENLFRQDLYFRLNVTSIVLPPLRDRPEDIPDLVRYFLWRHGAQFGTANPVITSDALDLLRQLPWPGNIRHLQNVVRKALLVARGLAIDKDVVRHVLDEMVPPRPATDQAFAEYVGQLLAAARNGELENVRETVVETVHRELYTQAIQRADGDQSKAAHWLGVSRPTMLEHLRKFGLH